MDKVKAWLPDWSKERWLSLLVFLVLTVEIQKRSNSLSETVSYSLFIAIYLWLAIKFVFWLIDKELNGDPFWRGAAIIGVGLSIFVGDQLAGIG